MVDKDTIARLRTQLEGKLADTMDPENAIDMVTEFEAAIVAQQADSMRRLEQAVTQMARENRSLEKRIVSLQAALTAQGETARPVSPADLQVGGEHAQGSTAEDAGRTEPENARPRDAADVSELQPSLRPADSPRAVPDGQDVPPLQVGGVAVAQADIDTLEKVAWDAKVEHVLIYYRDLIGQLRERIREADRAAKLEHARAIRAEGVRETAPAPVDEHDILAGVAEKQAEWLAKQRAAASPVPAAPDACPDCGWDGGLRRYCTRHNPCFPVDVQRKAAASSVPAAEGLRNFFSYEPDKREAFQRHIAAIDGRRPQDGHSDSGFSICQHPACVRANAPVPAAERQKRSLFDVDLETYEREQDARRSTPEGLDVETLARETAQRLFPAVMTGNGFIDEESHHNRHELKLKSAQAEWAYPIILAALRAVTEAKEK